jgi:hemoglobin/transferrin/lactoferrin receptor protein
MFHPSKQRHLLRAIPLPLALTALSISAFAADQPKKQQPAAPVATASAPETIEQKEVVVTATRLESAVQDVPYTAHSLAAATQFENKLLRTVPDSLRELPGVMIQKTSNAQGSPYLRGFTGYRTLALIDGVRFNNSIFREGPNQYWNTVDSLSLAGMELVMGQGSVLYGSDAIGGTLNLLTQSSNYQSENAGEFFIHGGTSQRFSSAERSWTGRVHTEFGVGDEWGLHLGATMRDFGNVRSPGVGRQPFTGYEEWAYDARLDISLDANWELTVAHQALTQEDAWRTHSTIYGVSFAGTEVGTDKRRVFDQERSLSYLKLRGEELKGPIQAATLTLSYQTGFELQDRVKKDNKGELSSHDIDTWGVDLQLESATPIGALTYGVDFYHDSVDTERTDFKPNGAVDKVRIQGPVADDSSYDLLGLFLQDDITLTDRVHLFLGGRYSRAEASLGRYEDPITGGAKSFSQSWDNASFSARVVADLDEQKQYKLFGGWSQAFRAPNLSDLSRLDIARGGEREIPVTDLDAETFQQFEVGVKASTGSFTGSLSYFYTDIKDLIVRKPTGRVVDEEVLVSKANAGSGYAQGVELGLNWEINDQWTLFGNMTYINTETDSFPDSSSRSVREPLPRTMPLTGTAGVRWTAPSKKVWLEFVGIATDRADRLNSSDKNDGQRVPPDGTPGYTLLTLRSGWQISEQVQLLGSVDNLLNQSYRVHGSGSNEPGLGATLAVKVAF